MLGGARLGSGVLGGAGFSPAGGSGPPVAIAAGNLRAWFSMQAAGTLFQDDALTTPATAVDDPLGGWADWYGVMEPLVQSSAPAKPTVKSAGGGLLMAQFDGVDDLLRGATASAWKALHGPLGGGIYIVAEWTGTDGLLIFAMGTTAIPVSSSTSIGFRGYIRNTTSTHRPYVNLGDGSAAAADDGVTDSWLTDVVRMVKYENDSVGDTVRVQAEPSAEQSASSAAVTRSSSDGGSFFITSQTSTLNVREILVRSPILTASEYAAVKAHWNTQYGLGL